MKMREIPFLNRRVHERTKIAIPCKLVVGTEVIVGKTKDLSLGGVCLTMPIPTEVAKKLKGKGLAALMLPRGEIQIPCKVIRVEQHAVAVRFKGLSRTEMEDELREFLRTQLGQLL